MFSKKITAMQLVSTQYAYEFDNRSKALIRQGFQPSGSLFVTRDRNGDNFTQLFVSTINQKKRDYNQELLEFLSDFKIGDRTMIVCYDFDKNGVPQFKCEI